MVRVGENLGSLDHVILRLAEIEEKRNILNLQKDILIFLNVLTMSSKYLPPPHHIACIISNLITPTPEKRLNMITINKYHYYC